MSSGDGWTTCHLGHRHWGLFGAAGILVVRQADVLLQLRAGHTHNGNTWSVPGGAVDSLESAVQAALREAHEEVGISATDLQTVGDVVDDHGGWAYTTVIARLLRPAPFRLNHESAEVRWVPITEVGALELHPGFAVSWPSVLAAVELARR
jgi:8-oxo-dGTP pyrophosphatase MutT (NUDIX family)